MLKTRSLLEKGHFLSHLTEYKIKTENNLASYVYAINSGYTLNLHDGFYSTK